MSKNKKLIYLGYLNVILFTITLILYFNDLINYVIVTGTITILLFILFCYILFAKKDEKTLYLNKLKKILKTYDSILVYADKDLELEDENIIIVKDIIDLITAQEKIKKPILYFKEEDSSHFILQDEKELLIYNLKLNSKTYSEFENIIKQYIKEKSQKNQKEKRILNNLANTTIIRLGDGKFYKVSPKRKKKK